MWVVMIKKKLDIFNAFKKFKSLVESEKKTKIGCLRVD